MLFFLYVSLRLHGQFPLWNARLAAGFNLLFYGFGSKKVSPRISQIARVVRTVHGRHPPENAIGDGLETAWPGPQREAT